jgi:hypothetical protein
MSSDPIAQDVLDTILALQITIAWAGEGLCEPKRLNWWRTDLIDKNGGGDLCVRLFPKTHVWAALEAVRQVSIQQDRQARWDMANPDAVRTLFFWGFTVDEKLAERLTFHKKERTPLAALPFPIDIGSSFSRTDFEEAIRIPNQKIAFQVTPSGRQVTDTMPEALNLCAKKLAAALLPLADDYPMPFYRLAGK